MNIRFLITAAVAVLSISVFAQGKPPAGGQGKPGTQRGGPGGPGGMRRGMPEELKKKLAMTPAQEKKLAAISAKYMPKFRALKPEERMTKGRELMMAMRKEADGVYTAKQKDVLKKWREAHPRRGGPGGRPGGPGAGKGKGDATGGGIRGGG